jgi:shikimate kinase
MSGVVETGTGAAAAEGSVASLDRSIVLVGLMGAGKTSVGRRLAKLIEAPFTDADDEIVAAAGMDIPGIFETYGEGAFRDLERRVIARLLREPPRVLAFGGGAFVDPATRALAKERAVTVWLRADLDTLVARTERRRASRPLLAGADPREVLRHLMEERHPLYATADHVIDSGTLTPDALARDLARMLVPAEAVA